MTKLEKELRRREERRINSINKAESDLAEDALRVLWNVVLIMIGVVIGLLLSASRSQAAETVSIPPRAEYVGVIPTEPQSRLQGQTNCRLRPCLTLKWSKQSDQGGSGWADGNSAFTVRVTPVPGIGGIVLQAAQRVLKE